MKKNILGKIERSHKCAAGWRSHTSTVVVERISPKMGVIIDSDGGNGGCSNRQRYSPSWQANYEIGQKIRLSSLFDVQTA